MGLVELYGRILILTFSPNTIDLEIFVLGNFRMINFHVENFRRNNPYHGNVNSAHKFS